jgi:phosphoglycolate phosphatase-like HAD superfamily hydrolase
MKIFNIEYNAFFFDFDGVLADSVEVKTNAFAKLFEKFGSEIQAKVVKHHRNNGGMTRKDKFVYYYQNYLKKPLDHVEMEQLCNAFSELVVDNVVAAPEIPGAESFLKKCCNKAECFVVSATPDEEIKKIVNRRGIDVYFYEILGSSCSKTEHVNNLLDKYNFNSKQCLFWGDAGSDYRAAIETGVDFIGILPNSNAPLLKIAPDIRWFKNFLEIDSLD